ncbi:hypothetical protein DLR60_10995 [Vibrio tarriae]|uniref:Uncharacterized protein n=1 Tax=Vibrio tarriae TaxID=2014742 RepID=A0AAU8WAQ2_9VIBR|nr:hypothetical protein CEQ48_02640 [Vibrio tarriae]RBM26175.1 hypothetical protein DLR59_12005 [Vibrio tarriae]RBM31636.1 hypothetical protein DLR61_04370 [Vibrio tarriae]RBM33758.1 hypothetical protein DLR63_18155 [Vibrio tarriae]RBM37421.1 hypothetical protein DLR58_00115 [Vibrio tarriae]
MLIYKRPLLSRGSPSQLTLLVNSIVHIIYKPIAVLAIGYFFVFWVLSPAIFTAFLLKISIKWKFVRAISLLYVALWPFIRG